MTFSRLLFLFTSLCMLLIACDDDDTFNTNPDFRLAFSVDTLSFDTLFTGFGSTTKRLKVYNQSGKKVRVDRIFLNDLNSPYRMNVNGVESNGVVDVEIAGKDSLYIFLEVELQDQDEDAPRLLEDQINFEFNGSHQKLVVETYAQDVYPIDSDLLQTTVWTGNRPYVLTKSVATGTGVKLSLEEGARVYFKKNAGLQINGDFEVNGSFEKPVYFGSTRLEELYENVPGQWDGIYISSHSQNVDLRHFVLEDGKNGLIVEQEAYQNQKVHVEYAQVKNFTEKGISISNRDFKAHDLLVANCGMECIELNGQGDFELVHATLYNRWHFSPRMLPILSKKGEGNQSLKLQNTIVWGSKMNELILNDSNGVTIEHSLLSLGGVLQDQYASVTTNCIFNENPLFIDEEEFDLRLKAESPAINKGKIELANTYAVDMDGRQRNLDDAPDMGGFEFLKPAE